MTLYNSAEVLQGVRREIYADLPSRKHRKAEKIAAALDDFANTRRGQAAANEVLLCGGEPVSRDTFKKLAADYVYESGIILPLVWIFAKPLVMWVIERFIESMLFSYERES